MVLERLEDDRVLHRSLPIGGERRRAYGSGPSDTVYNPFDGSIVATIGVADASDLDFAIGAAQRAFASFRRWPAHRRQGVLRRIVALLGELRGEFVEVMIAESGKPASLCHVEIDRAVRTFELAAEECTRDGGAVVPLDAEPGLDGYTAFVRRAPIGVIGAIAPFNFSVNLVAHKLAPAIAAGNTMVLKAPPQSPLAPLMLADVCYDSGLPPEALSVVHCPPSVAQVLATDDRIAMLSFTGSADVGWHLKRIAGKKKVALELGGNAAAIVCSDADLSWAAKRCAMGAFAQAGQICIKVQRIFVARERFSEFVMRFCGETERLGTGDPADPETVVGPLIDAGAAKRVCEWIDEAVAGGARIESGGGRRGNVVEPTILTGTTPDMRVEREEVFGPVAVVSPFDSLDEAFARVNDSRYGLQAGVFTYDVRTISLAFEMLEVGGVIAGDYPTLRSDRLPYGGIKDSGLGREGVRWAMDEMTQLKTLVVKHR